MSSYLTLLQSRSTKTLSSARPRPSRLTATPASSRRPVYSRDVNCDPKSVLKISGRPQGHRHPPAAVERGVEELPVDRPHQPQILLRLGSRREVVGRAVEVQEVALSTHAQMRMVRFDECPLLVNRSGQAFFSATRSPC